jgi:biopolymer transport protein ExbD
MASRNLGAAPDLAPTPSSGGVTSLDVTPLLDVLLVLLVIGMVSLGLSRRSIPVALPGAGGPGPAAVAPVLLELSSEGGYRLNGQIIPAHQLPDLIQAIFLSRPVKVLFIRTSPARTYQDFIQAADLARGAGVVTVAVVGAPPVRFGTSVVLRP